MSELSIQQHRAFNPSLNPPKDFVECCGCGIQVHALYTDRDHVRARFLGGKDGEIQTLCLLCHRAKSIYEKQYLSKVKQQTKDLLNTVDKIKGLNDPMHNFQTRLDKVLQIVVPTIDIQQASSIVERNYRKRKRSRNKRTRAKRKKKRWTKDEESCLVKHYLSETRITTRSQKRRVNMNWKKVGEEYNRQRPVQTPRRSLSALRARMKQILVIS